MNPEEIRTRFDAIRTALRESADRAGRTDQVALVAVSKTVDLERIRAAIDAGQRLFGENRVQEAVSKMDALSHENGQVEWHLLGHVQTNKAKLVVGRFACVQSLDSLRLATELNRRAEDADVSLSVLLEVNVAGEASKSGFDPDTVEREIGEIFDLRALRVLGLMTMAPLSDNVEDVRWVFRALRELRDRIRQRHDAEGFAHLSMGMSNDFRVAVEEGATIVRIGRALFGDRPKDRNTSYT